MLTFDSESGYVGAAAIGPDNRHLAAGRWLWSLADPAAPAVELTGDAIGFLPDGRLVVGGRMLALVHPDAPHKGVVRFPAPEGAGAVLPDGRLLGLTRDAVVVSDVVPGGTREVGRVDCSGRRGAVAVSPDGLRAAVGMSLPAPDSKHRSAVLLYDFATGAQVNELAPATGELVALAWSPCGRYVAGVLGARLVVWSAEDGRARGELEAGGTRLFRGPRFHPSGRFLAAGGANIDGGVYGWGVGTWEELLAFRWPVGPVASVNFSPDGTLAVAGGERGRILVWDVE